MHCLQAIKDAEADERLADQLAALQLTLSALADQQEPSNASEDVPDLGDGTKPSATSQVCGCCLTGHLKVSGLGLLQI